MNPYTSSEKRKIKSDWKDALKFYSNYKSNILIKRNDPMVTGVYLHMGRIPECYTPVFFIHNLMYSFESIPLSGYGSMRNANQTEDAVTRKRHTEQFLMITSEFQKQYPIAFLDCVDFNMIDSYYNSYIEKPPTGNSYPLKEMTDHILLMFWYGVQESEINKKIKQYEHIQESWRESVHPESRKIWRENVLRLFDHQKLLRTIESEIAKFKIEKINTFPMKRLCEAGK
ncbi:MAG: hypothetical protein FWG14_14325 [Peptococcaceae bacterium]|nr:hypothetical protein [Peptococcaceae bacterium]